MLRFITWLDRLHWLWLLLVAPFLLFPNPKRSLAMLVIPVSWILHWIVSRHNNASHLDNSLAPPLPRSHTPFPLTPLNGSLLLMAVMVLVSVWATYDIAFSLPKLSGMVLGFGIFFAIVREGSHTKGWWLSLLVFLAMGAGVAGLGFLGTRWTTTKLNFLNPITTRFPMIFSDLPGAKGGFQPNEVAGALTWVLPVLLALSVYIIFSLRRSSSPKLGIPKARHATGAHGEAGGWGVADRSGVLHWEVGTNPWQMWSLRLFLWLSTLFVLAVFALTQSRGGYLAMVLTLPALLFIALPRRWRWILLGLILVTGLIIGFALSKADLFAVRDWLIGSGLTTASAFSLNTLEGRVEIWSRAIYGLQDFSFTGMGMNTFREVVHVIYPLFSVSEGKDIGYGYAHAHNEFLQAGLDLGIPGMIAFIALYVGAFWMLIQLWRSVSGFTSHVPGSLGKAITLGLGGGLTAHLLYGLTDAVALGAKPGVLFWMLLGLITGLHNQACSSVIVSD